MSVAASFGLGTASGVVATRILDRISGPFRHLQDAIAAARPAAGVKTAVSFGDTIQQLVADGIIDPGKFRSVYAEQGNIPQWVERLFVAPSAEPILLSAETAPYLLNLLWPLGLSVKATFNEKSP